MPKSNYPKYMIYLFVIFSVLFIQNFNDVYGLSIDRIPIDGNPLYVAVNPSNDKVYVANGDRFVTVIDSDNIIDTIPIDEYPKDIAVNPNNGKIYLSNGAGIITVIDSDNDNIIDTIPIDGSSATLAVNPNNGKVYVANYGGTVTVIDSDNNIVDTISIGGHPLYIAVNQNNDKVYVTGISKFVTVIDSNGMIDTIPIYGKAVSIAVNPSNGKVYVASDTIIDRFITVIDSDNDVIDTISIDGNPTTLAVNQNNDKVYVANYGGTVTVIDSDNTLDTILVGGYPTSIAVNQNNGKVYVVTNDGFITVIDSNEILVTVKKHNGGCADCTPPTLGLNSFYKRVVDDGFSYNGNSVQVEKWHTEYPLINATVGEMNTVEIKVYENNGIYNMNLVQYGMGGKEIGQPRNTFEVLVELHLGKNSTTHDMGVEEIIINDKDNLIDNNTVTADVFAVPCMDSGTSQNCLNVTLEYSYRERTINNIMLVSVTDKARNTQNFYFNDGVAVFGESMNPVPFHIIQNKHTKQQTEDLTKVLFRVDKINHIWADIDGIEYLKISENRFDRITPPEPYQCNDPPLDEINVPTRNNCHFRELTSIWDK